jgi:hypothetical protein
MVRLTPGARKIFRHAVHDCAGRTERHEEPEEDAEDMTVGSDERLFDRQSRDFPALERRSILPGPFRQQAARGVGVAGIERELDRGEVMAVVPESEGEIDDEYVPDQRGDRAEVGARKVDEERGQRERPDHRKPAQPAVFRLACVAPCLYLCGEGLDGVVDRIVGAQRFELFNQQGTQYGEKGHRKRLCWEGLVKMSLR